MLYSIMREGEDCYVSLHGEWILRHPQINKEEWNILTGKAEVDVFREIEQENLCGERLFLDFSYIEELAEGGCEALACLLKKLLDRENEVYLLDIKRACAGCIRTLLSNKGIEYVEEITGEADSCFGVIRRTEPTRLLTVSECRECVERIHKENLLILMEEGSQGKFFDLERLLADEEFCLQYFFYKLAVKMVVRGVVSLYPKENGKVGIMPVHKKACVLAEKLADLLGITILTEDNTKKHKVAETVVLVRDVIHMSYEISRPAMKLAENNVMVNGVVCLVDIYTGFGQRKEYISLYTIDFSKGIGYRLHKR